MHREVVDEFNVLRPTCNQFGDSEIVRIEAPTGRARAGIGLGDESIDPTVREDGRLDRDPST